MNITIPNQFLNFINSTLNKLQLNEKESSARRRFLRSLQLFDLNLDADRKALKGKLCEKDEAGNLKVANNEYVFKNAEIRKSFEAEWLKLNDQTFTIEVSESNEADLKAVKAILEAEVVKFRKEHKDFNAGDFDYVANIEELIGFIKL